VLVVPPSDENFILSLKFLVPRKALRLTFCLVQAVAVPVYLVMYYQVFPASLEPSMLRKSKPFSML
jgi:hypothetical protein